MRHTFISVFVSILLLCGCAASINAQESCDLKTPPRQAGVDKNHGSFFFIYPRTVSTSYSGCQIMWDEKGTKWFILTFEKGNLTTFDGDDPLDASQKKLCKYENGSLITHQQNKCPEYNAVKNGILVLPADEEPIVPLDRDLRRRVEVR